MMARVKTIARRTFLIGSAAVLGGVAFGAYAYLKPVKNPLLEGLAKGEAAITPFVRIDAQGVTLITPRADLGQGGYSTQAMLICEELDIDPASVRLEPGMPDAAYWNGALLEEGAPFPAHDTSWLAERARSFMHVPGKLLGLQVTGGSSTVPDMFDRLRMAGAVARETLKAAAGGGADLRTEDGHVVMPDGTRKSYASLAEAASQIDPVTDVVLRTPDQWRLIGKPSTTRVDMEARCTGTFHYGIDMARDGMVYAAVRANPGIGGAVTSIDSTVAEGMRGVLKVVPITGGVGVIADNTWRAMQAVAAVQVDFAPPAYPATSEGLFAEIAASFTEERLDTRNRDDGDMDVALGEGDVLEAEYRIPYLAHAPLEPMNAVVQITGGRCDIWTGTQIPGLMRSRAAKLAGLDEAAVFVHVQPMGGSFGARLEDTYALQAVELAMAMPGVPVKLTWSREEDFTHDYPRPAQIARARGKVSGGKVEAFDLSIAGSSATVSWLGRVLMPLPGPDASAVAGAADQPFAIPHYRVTGYRAPEMVPVSSWRSVGASGNGFLHDGFLDELIHAAGADPLAERIRLCPHDVPRRVLEAVGDMCDWSGHKMAEGRGRGVAFCTSFGVPCAQVVEVVATDQGIRIEKVWVAVDVGRVIEPLNLEAQVMGGVIFGLGHAMNCELTYAGHKPEQENYHAYEGMRLHQCPEIEVKALENGTRLRGIGEPGVPPAAPALANAIFAATGQRIRELPLSRHVRFV